MEKSVATVNGASVKTSASAEVSLLTAKASAHHRHIPNGVKTTHRPDPREAREVELISRSLAKRSHGEVFKCEQSEDAHSKSDDISNWISFAAYSEAPGKTEPPQCFFIILKVITVITSKFPLDNKTPYVRKPTGLKMALHLWVRTQCITLYLGHILILHPQDTEARICIKTVFDGFYNSSSAPVGQGRPSNPPPL
jgi:hypothetical protein